MLLITLVMAVLMSTAVLAASKPKLNKTKVTLTVGKSTTLKLQNLSAKQIKSAKWTSSNKKVATVSNKGKIKAKKAGTAKITVVTKSGFKAKCTVKVVKTKSGSSSVSNGGGSGTVYWTPSGSVYHRSRGCRSLARSKTVYSGSIASSGKPRVCKNCG